MKPQATIKYLVAIVLLAIFSWQIAAQMNAPRDKGDAAGFKLRIEELEAKVARLEGREALLTTGQTRLYESERLEKACRIIQADPQSDEWGVYLFDESSPTGNVFTKKPIYVPLAIQDESEMAFHIAALAAE
jgi:hypothetical protein